MQKDKIRDMLRSILPSKAERRARYEKRHANKQNRVGVRQSLRSYSKNEWGDDSEDELAMRVHTSDRIRQRNIREMKMERRAADKINHFVRWCEKRTAHIPDDQPQEKYYLISGLVGGPTDVIREHALGHFMQPDYDFNLASRDRWKYRYVPSVPGSGLGAFDRAAFSAALQYAFEHYPAQLNLALKGNQRRFSSPLYWRACTSDDSCIEIYHTRSPLYTYQTTYGGIRTSWERPLSYREGTLVSRLAVREHVDHDLRVCENKILVNKKEDLDRIVNKFFGNREVYYRNPYYGDRSLADRLIPFFISKGLLEERND